MRKIFLQNLPKRGNCIDWKKSVGYKVPFIYDDIKGEVEISSKERDFLIISYKDKQHKIYTGEFKRCEFGKVVGKIKVGYRFEIKSYLKNDKQDFLILDRKIKRDKQGINRKYYKYHCNKCGNEEWIIEDSLLKKHGCNTCGSFKKKIKLGINTIWDTDRWMCDLGISEEDAKKYSRCSGKKIIVTCPTCGNNKEIVIKKIYERKSIGCECRSSKSYPEKFVFDLLKQLNFKFKTEYSPSWVKPKRYDFYIPSLNCIIETHGRQHYEGHTFEHLGGKSLKEEQANDEFKRETALKNNIKYYIELDCRESNLEWIKNSILNSELAILFNLNNIDWKQASNYAIKNTTKQICSEWNNKKEYETIEDVGRRIMLSRSTIARHLKIGTSMGLCIYNPELESKKAIERVHKNKINKE